MYIVEIFRKCQTILLSVGFRVFALVLQYLKLLKIYLAT